MNREDKQMKRFSALTMTLIFAGSILTGCATTETASPTAASSVQVTESTVQTEETITVISDTSEATAVTHQVEVKDMSVTTLTDDSGDEYKMIIPMLIVDGVEAEAVNSELNDYIEKNHPLTRVEYNDGDIVRHYVDGETTRYAWGVNGNIVSIIIISSETFTDGVGYDIFNYNADTLQAAGNDEVIASFGMTEEEFNGKVADAYRAWWDSEPYLQDYKSDLDKSIGAISAANVTPFVTPDGSIGAAGLIYMSGSQFSESIKCFDLNSLEIVRL